MDAKATMLAIHIFCGFVALVTMVPLLTPLLIWNQVGVNKGTIANSTVAENPSETVV